MSETRSCRICGGPLHEFLDLGPQPMGNAFVPPRQRDDELYAFRFRLAVALCGDCSMAQLVEDVRHDRMFHQAYPYRSSGSTVMRAHFEEVAQRFLREELTGADPFIVELGSNDGIMLRTVAKAGVRHLGVEPCGDVAEVGRAHGIRVCSEFFDEGLARRVRAEDGRADVIFAANTFSHIDFLDSILRGIKHLLAPDGVFVFEDPYLGDIVRRASFDQIYDEHIFFFTARSVQDMAARYGLELVDVEEIPVHGGELRCTLAHAGAREPAPAVARLIERETAQGITEAATLSGFADAVRKLRTDLVRTLREIAEQGGSVVGYGATAKSTTLLNYCGIGPELISYICDSTPEKQGRLTPGTHIPIRGPEAFRESHPDYALLLAWNHKDEILRKESAFRAGGGRWISYVPDVRIE
ncbi:class I SAM-dependent methyltransferase [Streptomyces sp. 891-h]|uniref:class I SAM-dependent methyltransferase n=1 Tax=unclassified Streptomyces TaxID=2593676 RepID=UPI001FAAC159|nr:class I SAM-dependent methyltransferase [Streptomyces sp. 891-h]UNZ20463.1 class I SAM-dependent methyltransferase [Streptomyces sp. 891-h]